MKLQELFETIKRRKPSENDSNERKVNSWHNMPHNGRWTQDPHKTKPE